MPPRDHLPSGITGAFFAVCLILNLGFAAIGWNNSLLEFHSFRQVQTALLIREFIDHGINFGCPLPLFGPPWYVPFEFPLYQTTAAFVAVTTGWPLAEAARLTALLFFFAGLPAIFLLLDSLRIKPAHRWLILALVVLSPTYLYYSRSVMIESCAWSLSLWFTAGFTRSLRSGSRPWITVAIAAGILAGLAKVTTFAAFLIPCILFTLSHLTVHGSVPLDHRRDLRLAIAKRALVMTLPGLLFAWAWIQVGDGLKALNPLANVMVSSNLRDFTMGAAELRLNGEFWSRVFNHTTIAAVVPANLGVLLIFGVIWTDRRRWIVLAMIASFLGGPLLFSNLYFVHDYYYYATSVFLLLALGIAWGRILELKVLPVWGRFAFVLLSIAAQIAGYANTYLDGQREELTTVAELPIIVKKAVPTDGIVLVFGQEWNPLIPYYADRRMIMVIDQKFAAQSEIEEVLNRLNDGVAAIVATGVIRTYPEFLAPYLQRFDIADQPLLVSEDTAIYLRRRNQASAIASLNDFPLSSFQYFVAPEANDAATRPQFVITSLADKSTFSHFTPLPRELIHPFGVSAIERDNDVVLSAHASSDLLIPIPIEARTATVGFGLMPGAYENPATASDGVEFLFEYVRADGAIVTLEAIMLDPLSRPEDRGEQTISVSLPPLINGELRLRTLPGPHQNSAFDWSYWSQVQIR